MNEGVRFPCTAVFLEEGTGSWWHLPGDLGRKRPNPEVLARRRATLRVRQKGWRLF